MGNAGYITLTFKIDPAEEDEGGYVSYCPELEIASQGEDIDEALENIKDAALTFLAGLAELDNPESFFKERNLLLEYEPSKTETRNVAVTKGEVVSILSALVGSQPAFA